MGKITSALFFLLFFCHLWADFTGCAGRHGSRRAEGDRHQRLRTQTQDHQRSGEAHQWAAE